MQDKSFREKKLLQEKYAKYVIKYAKYSKYVIIKNAEHALPTLPMS